MERRNSKDTEGADLGNSPLAERARAGIAEAAEPLKQEALATAERQKEAGAARLGGLAQAVHGAAHELESQLPQAAGYAHDAASHLERVSTSLREHNIDELMNDLGRFARSQPAALFGGAVLAGIVLSRVLKNAGHAARR